MQSADRSPEPATCKLCGSTAVLQESHIVPRWTYKRAIKTGNGDPNLVMITNDVARQGGRQLKEYMLCDDCEAIIERPESYLARITIQEDDAFPALAKSPDVPELCSRELRVVDVSALDVRAIERFAMSVIWRASESAIMPKVSLGKYHRDVATYLLDQTAELPPFALLTLTLVDVGKGPRVDRVVVAPYTGKERGYHTHRFSVFGMFFNVMIGALIPADFAVVSLRLTKQAIVSDGMQQVGNALAEQMQRIRSNGGLRLGRRASRRKGGTS